MKNLKITPNYNEKRIAPQVPTIPISDEINFNEHVGAYTRMKIVDIAEELLKNSNFNNFIINDVKTNRSNIKNALIAIIREGRSPNVTNSIHLAVSLVGALKFIELSKLVSGLALDSDEEPNLRTIAIDSLLHLNRDTAIKCYYECVNSSVSIVKEKAIKALFKIEEYCNIDILNDINFSTDEKGLKIYLERYLSKDKNEINTETENYNLDENSLIEQPSFNSFENFISTTFNDKQCYSASGGVDLVKTEFANKKKVKNPKGFGSYEVLQYDNNKTRIKLIGNYTKLLGKTRFLKVHSANKFEHIVEIETNKLEVGKTLPLEFSKKHRINGPKWIPDTNSSPVILSVSSNLPWLFVGEEFSLILKFQQFLSQQTPFITMVINMPNSNVEERIYKITDNEQREGEKEIKGFVSQESGEVVIGVTLFSQDGGSSSFEFRDLVLPQLKPPLQLLPQSPRSKDYPKLTVKINPAILTTSNMAPARYNSNEDRYYCRGEAKFISSLPQEVTIEGRVTAIITDDGAFIDLVDINIGSFKILRGEEITKPFYISFGANTNTYNVFNNYGDVRIDFDFCTTVGIRRGYNIWAAMAQVKLSLNFIGNFSFMERQAIQLATETKSSLVFEQQGLYISETNQFILPNSHPDWERFRDIIIDNAQNSSAEADELRTNLSSPLNNMQLWFVESFSSPQDPIIALKLAGFSHVPGSHEKGTRRSGLIIKGKASNILTGLTIAHEIGHYLGLHHCEADPECEDDSYNLMKSNKNFRFVDRYNKITKNQFLKMVEHPFVDKFTPTNNT